MVDYDPANQNSTDTPLVALGGKPSIADLKDAITASAYADSYDSVFLNSATKNDLIYICRQHGIEVPGLPGADDFTVNAPTIDTDPAADAVVAPATGEFTVVVSGSEPFQYQWQIDTGDGFEDIEGADEDTYTTPATVIGDDGNLYRVRVWNSAGATISESAELTVTSE